MRGRWLLRLAAAASVACIVAASAPERSQAAGIKDAVDSAICVFVESDAGATAGRRIITRLSGDRIRANGAVMSVAIWSAQQFCTAWVPRVTGALAAAFKTQGAPTAAPTQQDVSVILRRIQASGVVADLRQAGISSTVAGVRNRAGSMCRSLRQGANGASLGSGLAGNLRVAALAGLSGIVGLMKNCSSPPAPWQTDSISAALATTLVANTYPRDVEPPIVSLSNVHRVRASDGRTQVTLNWFSLDLGAGGVVSEPWLYYNGRWERLALNLGRADAVRVWLQPGTQFLFAVRGVDANGNASPYAYSAWFRA